MSTQKQIVTDSGNAPSVEELAAFWGGNKGMLDRISELETYSQKLEAERDELLAALKKCVKALGRSETTADIVRQMNAIETGQDAIARAEGRAE